MHHRYTQLVSPVSAHNIARHPSFLLKHLISNELIGKNDSSTHQSNTDVNSVFVKINLGFQLFAALYGGVALNGLILAFVFVCVQHVFYEMQH